MRNVIVLTTKKELEIYMNPSRQEIIRELGRAGEPVTPKYLSERLKISPSSVQFHLKKLEGLGIVQLDHTEQIRGITARYFTLADADISIGSHLGECRQEREVILENMVQKVFQGCCRQMKACPEMSAEEVMDKVPADIVTGIAFLTEEESRELRKNIIEFLEKHNRKRTDTHPWEYSFLAYKMEVSE
ncbi:helix-turn-helix domain-containing protein [uncultured Blautia sp.]|uniref:ArsR/SmtB family transcription factor n=1 Tax=uncultured Blautia sp. TaxID=765821 RepID=UPI00280B7F19|nr:helix-turn-helix domain-containing protein [uncultured Blautia sp.]